MSIRLTIANLVLFVIITFFLYIVFVLYKPKQKILHHQNINIKETERVFGTLLPNGKLPR